MRSGGAVGDGNAGVNAPFTADRKRVKVNVDGLAMAVLRSGWTSITIIASHSFEFEKRCQLFVGSDDESLSVVAVRVCREIRAPPWGRRPARFTSGDV